MPQNVDDYVKQGMYGQKQTKPDERRKFLGTIRERIVIALTQPQVRREGTHREVEAKGVAGFLKKFFKGN
ncbi:Uncharacterized conserved protein [Mycobacteroides abscessus subsp. abscessus]|nr:Uncharacterized conserved protein [Mycobacteroides abscessus subsp. abscessus]